MIFEFENYRAFIDRQRVDLSEKFTFVTGRNNSGKSNILRIIALTSSADFLGGAYEQKRDSHTQDTENDGTKIYLPLNTERWINAIPPELKYEFLYNQFLVCFTKSSGSKFLVNESISSASLLNKIAPIFIQDITREHAGFTSGNQQKNAAHLINTSGPSTLYNTGSVYIPSIRLMTKPGVALNHFNSFPINSQLVEPAGMVDTLKKLDRPSEQEDLRSSKSRIKEIENFIAHCLECDSVEIEVAHDSTSIALVIDGERRRLNELGTGVEQLLFIGTGAAAFPDKLILIEEPELHFHPRSIRRMISYLNENLENKFVITTHSAAVLDSVAGTIHHVTRSNGKSQIHILNANNERRRVVQDLGYRPSDLLQSNFIIWVEGPTDRLYINEWLRLVDPNLVEGIDYTIIFYGGRILANHSFDDVDSLDDFVNAFSLNPNFAVIMDSDRKKARTKLNASKERVRTELKNVRAFEWITQGREIENYIPISILELAKAEFSKINADGEQFSKIIPPNTISKTKFAKWVIDKGLSLDVLDLKSKINGLVKAIREVKN